MPKQTCVSWLSTRLCFVKLAFGWMPIFIRRSRAGTLQIVSVVEEWTHGYLLPRILLFLGTHLLRERAGSEGVAAVCSGLCARSCVSRRKLHRSPCEHWPFCLSTGGKYLFFLQHLLVPFDSWPLLQIQFSHAWRQSFVIGVSDLYSFSPFVFQFFDTWEPMSSDESPCRTIRFWVDQTHVSSICTDSSRFHRMESLT